MGPSSAFLGVLFLSGTLGKGRLGNPQGVGVGRREGLGRVGWGVGACARAENGKEADRGEEKWGDLRTLGV
jgi:hypothetical protein